MQIHQQQLINAGKEREVFILREIAEAKKADPRIEEEQIKLIRERAGQLFDLQQAENADQDLRKTRLDLLKDEVAEVRSLVGLESTLHSLRTDQLDAGLTDSANETAERIRGVQDEITRIIPNLKRFARTFKQTDPEIRKIIVDLERLEVRLRTANDVDGFNVFGLAGFDDYSEFASSFSEAFGQGIEGAFERLGDRMDDLVEEGKTKWQAFWQVVGDGRAVFHSVGAAMREFFC